MLGVLLMKDACFPLNLDPVVKAINDCVLGSFEYFEFARLSEVCDNGKIHIVFKAAREAK